MLSHDESIGWFAMERLSAGVTRIWEHQIKREYGANIWLVKGRDRNLLVDSRFGLASLRENIPELNAKPIIVIATHSHCDHIGGLHEFANCAFMRRKPTSSAIRQSKIPSRRAT
jgi:glyoxylase-like metal-dependent hydrolase (beta-lactamase superfamily II)